MVRRGNIHDYLGMDFNSSEPRLVKVSMISCLKKVPDELPKELREM